MVYQRIRYFLEAARLGSFSKAAAQLYVSSQALSKQIALLEEELGGTLFERSPYGVTLTRLGEYARMRLEKVDRELADAMQELKSRAKDDKPRVNIGFFSSLPQEKMVTPLVSFLLAGFPEFQINLMMLELNEGKQKILNGDIDLLLTNTHEEDDWRGFRCMSFQEHEAKVVVSLLHPWAVRETITPEDMRQQTFLKMEMNSDHYNVDAEHSFYRTIPCKNVQMVNNFTTMFALLQQGEAFAVFPKAFSYMDQAKIKCFDYPGRKFIFHTAMIYNPNTRLQGILKIARSLEEEFDLVEV